MRIVQQKYEILTEISDRGQKELDLIEKIGRTAYKSQGNKDNPILSRSMFIKMLINRGHESVLEHSFLTVRFICDRGILAELTRHRLASFTAESTRYCNYSLDKFGSEITVIAPSYFKGEDSDDIDSIHWLTAVKCAEQAYIEAVKNGGIKPEDARGVLPTCLKTEVVISANYREWRHILKLRTAPDAHPQMQELMRDLLSELKLRIPVIFEDIPDYMGSWNDINEGTPVDSREVWIEGIANGKTFYSRAFFDQGTGWVTSDNATNFAVRRWRYAYQKR